MSVVAQSLVVFVIVAIACSYAAIKLMPAAWRRAFAARAATWAAHSGLSDATARRVEAKLSSGGACGSCDSCKACATPAVATGDGAASSRYRQIAIRRVA